MKDFRLLVRWGMAGAMLWCLAPGSVLVPRADALGAPDQTPPLLRRPPLAPRLSPSLSVAPRKEVRSPLVWDADQKNYTAKKGEQEAHVDFRVKNAGTEPVTINAVRTSCGCTVARLPHQPWTLKPGEGGAIHVTVDLRGKFGILTKTISVSSDHGAKLLVLKVHLAGSLAEGFQMQRRVLNMRIAAANRQAVFKNNCATCHAAPTHGKMGRALYLAACGICHESAHRATMVPDLRVLKKPTNAAYWRKYITFGKAGSLMPAFAESEGGPLSKAQIDSLVAFLSKYYPLRLHLPVPPPPPLPGALRR